MNEILRREIEKTGISSLKISFNNVFGYYLEVRNRFKEYVPEKVGGIAFLSGGQNSDVATAHLNQMNQKYSELPWNLTFSYGRALQQDALNAWSGSNREEGQKELLKRAKNNSLATTGNF